MRGSFCGRDVCLSVLEIPYWWRCFVQNLENECGRTDKGSPRSTINAVTYSKYSHYVQNIFFSTRSIWILLLLIHRTQNFTIIDWEKHKLEYSHEYQIRYVNTELCTRKKKSHLALATGREIWLSCVLFIYQLFWTQACPLGICLNGTQVPCKGYHPYPIPQPVKVGHLTGVYDPSSFRIVMWDLLHPTRTNQWLARSGISTSPYSLKVSSELKGKVWGSKVENVSMIFKEPVGC